MLPPCGGWPGGQNPSNGQIKLKKRNSNDDAPNARQRLQRLTISRKEYQGWAEKSTNEVERSFKNVRVKGEKQQVKA
jgi:hypothetical protein